MNTADQCIEAAKQVWRDRTGYECYTLFVEGCDVRVAYYSVALDGEVQRADIETLLTADNASLAVVDLSRVRLVLRDMKIKEEQREMS